MKNALQVFSIITAGFLICWLVVEFVPADPGNTEYIGDGVIKKTIEGHEYLQVGDNLTHSASCPNAAHNQ